MHNKQDVRVSYILTTRNRAPFLDRALANVREYITPEDELIVIDGASTDDTAEVVRKHGDIVSVFQSEPDCGESHGLNKGILLSRGQIIKILSDDDYLYPDAVRFAISVMESHPEVDAIVCGGEAFEIDPFTQESRCVFHEYLPPSHRLSEDVRNIFYYIQCGLGLFLTRRVIARVGLFDTTFLAVDTDYMSRLIACGTDFKYLNVKLYRHTTFPHSGQNNWPVCRRDRIRVALRHRAWTEIMDRETYPPEAVGEVLGLNELPGGSLLIPIIWCADRLRASRMPYLKIITFLIRALDRRHEFLDKLKRLTRLTSKPSVKTGGAIPIPQTNVPPVWDGSLR
jgi:glycosyltransferase involved in cell wall biosynthesis